MHAPFCLAIVLCAWLSIACTASAFVSGGVNHHPNHAQPPRIPTNASLQLKLVQIIARHGDRAPIHKIPNDDPVFDCESDIIRALEQSIFFTSHHHHYHSHGSGGSDDDAQQNEVRAYPSSSLSSSCNIHDTEYIHVEKQGGGEGGGSSSTSSPTRVICAPGQLTLLGAQQQYQLGRDIYARYAEELGIGSPSFNMSSEMYVRSVNLTRIIESTKSVLLGMFPPWSSSRPRDLPAINTIDFASEYMFPNTAICPYLKELYESHFASEPWLAHKVRAAPLHEKLAKIFNTTEFPAWPGLFEHFYCRKAHGIPYPNGITQDMVDEITEHAFWQFSHFYGQRDIAKYGIGPFVGEVLKRMQDTVQGRGTVKFALYLGHDTTVGPFLSALQIPYSEWPAYNSNIMTELYEDNNNKSEDAATSAGVRHFVRILYNGQPVQIPGCNSSTNALGGRGGRAIGGELGETLCPFSVFEAIATQVVPSDYKTECQQTLKQ